MATFLPSSGAISINAINTLFARGNNLNSYRGTTYYTSTAGPFTFSSGAIAMNGFYGTGPTANRVAISYTFSASTANASLAMSSIPGYSAGTSDITITVNSGVYLYATSTANAGLTLTGGTAGDTITVVNNGNIIGQGGNGGNGNSANGLAGGPAFSLAYNISLNNTGYIAGGGSGGGGGSQAGAGGGGGGGAGGGNGGSQSTAPTSGGTGGTGGGIGSAGTAGQNGTGSPAGAGGGGGGAGGAGGSGAASGVGGGGGAGGRILPGVGGVRVAGLNGSSGTGGSANNTPPTETIAGRAGGGGGGWGAVGKKGTIAAAGKAINLNGTTITYIATGNVWGLVS
jgi:hypothetical protein